MPNDETVSRKLLKAKFDELLIPLGFSRKFSTWLRNNEETTFGVNIERWPMFESYFINLWVWFSPEITPRKKTPPDLAARIEDLLDGEEKAQFLLRCDFELDATVSDEDKVADVTRYLKDIGLAWLEGRRRLPEIEKILTEGRIKVDRQLTSEGWQKLRERLGLGATKEQA